MTKPVTFVTESGQWLPALSEDQMREVDRIAEQDFGLNVLQMMENAGRNLALHAIENLKDPNDEIVVLAGSGGNGGGGICCARHLHNRGFNVAVILTKDSQDLRGPAQHQFRIVETAGLEATPASEAEASIRRSGLTIDALIGYSLSGAPEGVVADLIAISNETSSRTIALDIPSGYDSTTGETLGTAIKPDRTLTLALPKIGLRDIPGEIFLADIGIPPAVYTPLGLAIEPIFGDSYWVKIEPEQPSE